MHVAVVMTTFNRRRLFKQTVESLRSCGLPFELVVVDNLSDDGTGEVIKQYLERGWIDRVLYPEKRERCFYHTELLGVASLMSDDGWGFGCPYMERGGLSPGDGRVVRSVSDLLLLSADDYVYKPSWLKVLTEWYAEAPSDVAICTLDFEPEWDWNEVLGVVDAGGHRALVRKTAPGANWCLRVSDWLWLESKFLELVDDILLDHKVCQSIYQSGKRICALDLCEHAGVAESLMENKAYSHAKPLDRKRWGV